MQQNYWAGVHFWEMTCRQLKITMKLPHRSSRLLTSCLTRLRILVKSFLVLRACYRSSLILNKLMIHDKTVAVINFLCLGVAIKRMACSPHLAYKLQTS